ncbi:MAG: AMP-binding protein [Flavobacteriales bacterium]|nr:AMP-binding protein [Flavobacteriales bacterium]
MGFIKYSMNQTLRINGEVLNHSELLKKEEIAENNWEKEIYHFAAWLTGNDDTPILFKTSGSTGMPKNIEFTKKNVFDAAWRTIKYFNLRYNQRFLLCLPAAFVAGRMMIARAWACGADLLIVAPSMQPLSTLPPDCKIHFAAFTPPQLEKILYSKNKLLLRNIDTIIIGGGVVKKELNDLLLDMPNNIYQTYGMTETLSHVAVKKLNAPADNYYHSVSEEIRFSTSPDQSLIVHVNNQEIKTTDQVRLINSKSFEWLGRNDFVINSGGLKIHPEQLEATLIKLGILKENRFYVTAAKDQEWGERPCLVTLDLISDDELQLINHHLQKHHQIKKIIHVSAFDYTPTGKLIRKKFD